MVTYKGQCNNCGDGISIGYKVDDLLYCTKECCIEDNTDVELLKAWNGDGHGCYVKATSWVVGLESPSVTPFTDKEVALCNCEGEFKMLCTYGSLKKYCDENELKIKQYLITRL